MDTAKLIAQRIAERRAAKNLKQGDLARLTGISQSQISRYEAGDSVPTPDNLNALAQVLEVTPGYLTGFEDDVTSLITPGGLTEDERALIDAYRSRDLSRILKLVVDAEREDERGRRITSNLAPSG